eukprot:EG_transcript_29808
MPTTRQVYVSSCRELQCKPNSALLSLLDSDNEKVWNCRNNYIGSENGFRALLAAVQANKELEELDLSSNYLTPENIHALVETLADHPSIRVVRLNNNRLYIDAGKELVRLARKNRHITLIETEDTEERNDNKIPPRILASLRRELEASQKVHA